MAANRETIAVFPGTFDPVTLGHTDLIRRASRLFTRIVIGVGHNPEKSAMFSPRERVEMIRELVREIENASVESYDGLTMEFVRQVGGNVILRGIRDGSDLRDELQFANANLIVGDVETVFLMTSEQYALTSSTLIKQIVELGGVNTERLRNLVPPSVLERLLDKIGRPR
ncbi:MAG: pantetheine-phosphate adenylyltransferase [Phycisphaerae bacterium]